MIQKENYNDLKIVNALSPVVGTDDTALTGGIVDNADFGSLTYHINLGTLSDANATFAVTMEHGDNSALSDTAAVTDADLVGTLAGASFTFADDGKSIKLGYKGGKRYTRIKVTPTGNTGNVPISIVAILGSCRKGPQSTQKI